VPISQGTSADAYPSVAPQILYFVHTKIDGASGQRPREMWVIERVQLTLTLRVITSAIMARSNARFVKRGDVPRNQLGKKSSPGIARMRRAGEKTFLDC
jgi:hypothetical protein